MNTTEWKQVLEIWEEIQSADDTKFFIEHQNYEVDGFEISEDKKSVNVDVDWVEYKFKKSDPIKKVNDFLSQLQCSIEIINYVHYRIS